MKTAVPSHYLLWKKQTNKQKSKDKPPSQVTTCYEKNKNRTNKQTIKNKQTNKQIKTNPKLFCRILF